MSTAGSNDQQWNKNHSAIKRIMSEIRELEKHPDPNFVIQPLEGNLFEWHFTLRGPKDTEFEQGVYHGRLILPENYPYKPPDIMLLTPNGRFELHKKICLSITSYHQESWSPSWGIRTIMLALISFFPSKAEGIGSMDLSKKIRQKLAKESHSWKCEQCNIENCKLLAPHEPSPQSSTTDTTDAKPQQEEIVLKQHVDDTVPIEKIQEPIKEEQIIEESKKDSNETTSSVTVEKVTQQEEQTNNADAATNLVHRRHSETSPQTSQRRPRHRRTTVSPPYTFLAQFINSLIFLVSIMIGYILFEKMNE